MKKILTGFLTVLLLASMVACSSKSDEGRTISLKVWGAQEDQELLKEMAQSFEEANPDNTYTFTFGVVAEPDLSKTYLEDPAAAADVFVYPDDQIYTLVNAGALYQITRNKDAIVAANTEGSVEAATVDDKLYGYPMTADNGYFLYYDKSVFSETDIQSLDTMMSVAAAADKKVFFDISNGWYIASFFLGAGLGFDTDKHIEWNSARGILVGEYIKAFTANAAFTTGADDILKSGIGNTVAAGVSGTWNAADIASILGDNYGAAKLPTYTLDGEQVQLGSFGGFKIVGINSQVNSDYATDAMDFAEWVTNETNQIKRFEARALGPSNINAAASDEVQNNVALAALAAQSPYAVSQRSVNNDTFWTPAEAFGTTLEAKDYSKSVKELLDELVKQVNAE